MVAERQSTGHDTRQLLKRAMLWGGGVAMLCAVGMNVVGRPMIGLLFGERYLAAIDLLLPISFYVVPVACLTILINYLMPLGRSGFFAVSMAAGYLLIFVLVSRFHHSVAHLPRRKRKQRYKTSSPAGELFAVYGAGHCTVFA